MSEELSGQVALVTGAGRGIGRAIAIALAGGGASVGVIARSDDEIEETVRAIASAGGRAHRHVADVRNPGQVSEAVETVTNELGPISVLVNNAGTPGPVGNDWDVDPEAWWECIESIVRGAFLFNRAVVPGMVERGGGRVIHVASASGTRPPGFPVSATSIAKTALIRLSEELAQSAKSAGVASFAIHPGVVNTRLLASYGFQIPEAMFSPPEKAGALCLALASGKYDALTGRYLTIDDDLDALGARSEELAAGELYTLRIKT